MQYFARSPKAGKPAQTYAQHVNGVLRRIGRHAFDVAGFSARDAALFSSQARAAAIYHDLGKLDCGNQRVLSGREAAKFLPVNHVDAGTAFLLDDAHYSPLAAIAVAAHHRALPDFIPEQNRGEDVFRDDAIKTAVDAALPQYIAIHEGIIPARVAADASMPTGDVPVFLRLLLSCLVDADHSDAAAHGKAHPVEASTPALRADERLARLDAYIVAKGAPGNARNQLRADMYTACRNADLVENIASCDSPVGSGKTTAVMAHLLAQAHKRNLRRIFVVLPFTNIIQQAVEVYREALVLPGERAEDVVAELHHRAEFESEDTRHLTALWRAPIIVTTAVAFFETLASNSPSTLRRLHELPGSAIFVDEAHVALPAKLLPVAWRWMNAYANDWSCYWLLASGSLCQFWKIKEISETAVNVPAIVAPRVRSSLGLFEKARIVYKHKLSPQSVREFAEWVMRSPGPRLVILNTVQSAAVVAEHFRKQYRRERVEHLSSALTPRDRAATLARVKSRLGSPNDEDWTLVATSCVEAGVDLSFRTGFRELSSLTSLLQASGRINRSGKPGLYEMYTFCLAKTEAITSNPGLENAAKVLREYIENGTTLDPSLTTHAIEKEIKLYGNDPISNKLPRKEEEKSFPFIRENFRVIEDDTGLVVVDEAVVESIRGGRIDWRALQQNSIRVALYKLQKLCIPQIADGIYHWNRKYDCFLGYMAGMIGENTNSAI